MKTLLLTLISVGLSLVLSNVMPAQESSNAYPPSISSETPTADYLNQQWYIGKKDEIFNVMKLRLNHNPQDLASLLVQYDYGAAFMDKDLLLEIIPQIKKMAQNMPEDFSKKGDIISSMDWMHPVVLQVTDEMIAAEKHKGLINGKELSTVIYLRPLEANGKLQPLTLSERSYIEGKITKEEFLKEINASSIPKTNDAFENDGSLKNNQTPSGQKAPNLPNKAPGENIPSWMFVLTGVLALILGCWGFVRLRAR